MSLTPEGVRALLGADEPAVMAALERLRDALVHVRRGEDAGVPASGTAPTVPGPLTLEQRAEVERFTAWVRGRDGVVS